MPVNHMPRFVNGKDLALRVSETERCAGKRANYHVYYLLSGKVQFDPSYEKTAEGAATSTEKLCQEIHRRKAFALIGVVSLAPAEL
jgi:hypothetical protein